MSIRVPVALKRVIEREAVRDQRTVADVVISALEARFVSSEATRPEPRLHEAQVIRAFAQWVLERSQQKKGRVAGKGGR